MLGTGEGGEDGGSDSLNPEVLQGHSSVVGLQESFAVVCDQVQNLSKKKWHGTGPPDPPPTVERNKGQVTAKAGRFPPRTMSRGKRRCQQEYVTQALPGFSKPALL